MSGDEGDTILSTGGNASAFLALLEKLSADNAWWADAACLGADPDLFFPLAGSNGLAAQRICGTCPVLETCKEAGRDELYGIWGGTSVEGRRDRRRGSDA